MVEGIDDCLDFRKDRRGETLGQYFGSLRDAVIITSSGFAFGFGKVISKPPYGNVKTYSNEEYLSIQLKKVKRL